MSNKIIHFFRRFLLLFLHFFFNIERTFFSSFLPSIRNLLSFISKTVVRGLLALDVEHYNKIIKKKQANRKKSDGKFPLIFNISCHSTQKEQKKKIVEKYIFYQSFNPTSHSARPRHISVGKSIWMYRTERLKIYLTYFQMKHNIFPQNTLRHVLNCFRVSLKKRHTENRWY